VTLTPPAALAQALQPTALPVSADTPRSLQTDLAVPYRKDTGGALGAQAGEARLREIVTSAGSAILRRVAETPFTIVLEARA
jgi:hypothetical protein